MVGVYLEFKHGLATLSFYRNGLWSGVAFDKLFGDFYPAVTMFYGEV